MKLSWKIVLVVLLIVTLTVSVSSYVMIAAAFQAELDSQASAAAEESPLLCGKTGRNRPISPPQMWGRRACVMGSSKRRLETAGIWRPSSAWS